MGQHRACHNTRTPPWFTDNWLDELCEQAVEAACDTDGELLDSDVDVLIEGVSLDHRCPYAFVPDWHPALNKQLARITNALKLNRRMIQADARERLADGAAEPRGYYPI